MISRFYHIVVLLALAIAGCSAASSHALAADWDRVDWGMTSQQIAAAYGKRARVLDPPIVFGDSYAEVVVLDIPLADQPFRAYFQMDNRSHRLAHVLLERRRQYADPTIWNAVVKDLREELGSPAHACSKEGERGRPTVVNGVWKRPGETVEATYLDFAAPTARLGQNGEITPVDPLLVQPLYRSLYPARRIVIRYSKEGESGLGCGRS
jgi:hypothetical protein